MSKKRTIVSLLAVALVAAVVIGGTLAYLQDKSDTVTNTFEKHTVCVDLAENGDSLYDIIPGTTEDKDPTVTVTADIPSYVFLEVEDETQGLVTYAIASGWTQLTDDSGSPVSGVYYRTVDGEDEVYTFHALKDDQVTYSTAITNATIEALSVDNIYLAFTAYAIQQAGFDSAYKAWTGEGTDAVSTNNETAASSAGNVSDTAATTLTASATPSTDESVVTTVVIPAGASTGEDNIFAATTTTDDAGSETTTPASAYILVDTTNNTISVSDGDGTVATLDITLYVNDGATTKATNTLTSGEYLVTTYITKGLSNVTIAYGTETWYATAESEENVTGYAAYYDADSGKLVFATKHFSQFTVSAEDVNLYIAETDTAYAALSEACAAALEVEGDTEIDLLCSMSGNGYSPDGEPSGTFTIDFNGHTYDVTGLVGSTGTVTQAFRVIRGQTVTLKNGTLTSATAKMLINKYGDLTLTDMVLDGTRLQGTAPYVLSNNCGTTIINGSTSITAPSEGVAFDVYYWPTGSYSTGPKVIVNTTGTITGTIEVASDGSTASGDNRSALTINAGTIAGSLSASGYAGYADIILNGGCYRTDVSAYCDGEHKAALNSDGYYEIVAKSATFNVTNDTELAAALAEIKSDSWYWNKSLTVNLAENTYSGDFTIYQYPTWNGVVGDGNTANNLAYSNGDTDYTSINFVGSGAVKFTGAFELDGWGNAGNGFNNSKASTLFTNITFTGTNEDTFKVLNAADNVSFNNCTFKDLKHILLGDKASAASGNISFSGCTFDHGNCLSGYFASLTVTNSTATDAYKGFINKQGGAASVTVSNCTVACSEYFLRTNNSGPDSVTVTNSSVTVTEADGACNLVMFRGANHSATFTGCTLGTTAVGYGSGVTSDNCTLTIN